MSLFSFDRSISKCSILIDSCACVLRIQSSCERVVVTSWRSCVVGRWPKQTCVVSFCSCVLVVERCYSCVAVVREMLLPLCVSLYTVQEYGVVYASNIRWIRLMIFHGKNAVLQSRVLHFLWHSAAWLQYAFKTLWSISVWCRIYIN